MAEQRDRFEASAHQIFRHRIKLVVAVTSAPAIYAIKLSSREQAPLHLGVLHEEVELAIGKCYEVDPELRPRTQRQANYVMHAEPFNDDDNTYTTLVISANVLGTSFTSILVPHTTNVNHMNGLQVGSGGRSGMDKVRGRSWKRSTVFETGNVAWAVNSCGDRLPSISMHQQNSKTWS